MEAVAPLTAHVADGTVGGMADGAAKSPEDIVAFPIAGGGGDGSTADHMTDRTIN